MSDSTLAELHTQVELVKLQLQRFAADIESEKGTRTRANEHIIAQIRDIEKIIWKAGGAILAVQALFTIFIAFFRK